jgi:hypothetical protein
MKRLASAYFYEQQQQQQAEEQPLLQQSSELDVEQQWQHVETGAPPKLDSRVDDDGLALSPRPTAGATCFGCVFAVLTMTPTRKSPVLCVC